VPLRAIQDLLNRYGALERVKQRAFEYTERAAEQLAALEDTPYRRALYSATELVVDRES
jgi:geranylgeranyl pyrophosphate synthase